MSLDLYSKIEPHLGFDEEIQKLYKEFLLNILQRDIKSVLDVGCGQGYFLQTLELNNIKASGIDLSKAQIEVCREKGLNAKHTDLCDIEQNYEAITAIFDVINYIPKISLSNFFLCAYNKINDGGYFIFDINTLFGFEEVAQGSLIIDEDDKFITIDAIYENKELTTTMTLFEKKDKLYSKEQSSITQYYHSKESLKKLLKNIGFEIEDIIEFNLHSDEISDKQIWVCTKN